MCSNFFCYRQKFRHKSLIICLSPGNSLKAYVSLEEECFVSIIQTPVFHGSMVASQSLDLHTFRRQQGGCLIGFMASEYCLMPDPILAGGCGKSSI